MAGDGSSRSTFKWDEGDGELELRGKEPRRFSAWKIFLPGFVVLAGGAALGVWVDGAGTAAVAVMGLASAWQVLLSFLYAVRRTEIEYLWPLEKHLRFEDATAGSYREKVRHRTVDLDGLSVNTRDIREVQVRKVVAASESEKLTEAFLVFDHRVILVERSEDRASIEQYAAELRERFGVEGEPGKPRPISSAPTQGPRVRELLVPLGVGAIVAAASYHLPALVGRLVALPALALIVAAGCALAFWLRRVRLRRASRRWVQEEFGIDPRRATREGRVITS